jgi:hypothetical protein
MNKKIFKYKLGMVSGSQLTRMGLIREELLDGGWRIIGKIKAKDTAYFEVTKYEGAILLKHIFKGQKLLPCYFRGSYIGGDAYHEHDRIYRISGKRRYPLTFMDSSDKESFWGRYSRIVKEAKNYPRIVVVTQETKNQFIHDKCLTNWERKKKISLLQNRAWERLKYPASALFKNQIKKEGAIEWIKI